MRKIHLLVAGLSMAVLACSSERKGMDLQQDLRVVARRVQAFEEGNLELVPYMLNFRDVPMDENYSGAFFTTMGKSRLFFPDHVVAAGGADSMVTREMPVLEWAPEGVRVDSFLLKMTNDPFAFLFRQECARGMLARTNLMQDQSPPAKDALWKYLKVVDEEGMYSPGLVWYALEALRGHKRNNELAGVAGRMIGRHASFAVHYAELTKQASQSQSDLHLMMTADLNEASRQNGVYLKRLKNEY